MSSGRVHICLDDPINFIDRTGLAGESEEKENLSTWQKIIKIKEIYNEESARRGAGNHNNEGDAMRHVETSRRIAEIAGESVSKTLGDLNEVKGRLVGQPEAEKAMDLHNNAEGRAAAREKRPVNKENLQTHPKKDVDNSTVGYY